MIVPLLAICHMTLQEAAVLRELQDRLGHSEQKIAELTAENRQLKGTVTYIEDKYKQMKKFNE